MMNATVRFGMYCLIAAALASAPSHSLAQDPPASAEKIETKSSRAIPFRGKLKAIDSNARTISFGETTLHVDDQTKILKQEKPAKLADGVVGEQVSGTYRKEGGKSTAVMVRFGLKTEAAKAPAAEKQ